MIEEEEEKGRVVVEEDKLGQKGVNKTLWMLKMGGGRGKMQVSRRHWMERTTVMEG